MRRFDYKNRELTVCIIVHFIHLSPTDEMQNHQRVIFFKTSVLSANYLSFSFSVNTIISPIINHQFYTLSGLFCAAYAFCRRVKGFGKYGDI